MLRLERDNWIWQQQKAPQSSRFRKHTLLSGQRQRFKTIHNNASKWKRGGLATNCVSGLTTALTLIRVKHLRSVRNTARYWIQYQGKHHQQLCLSFLTLAHFSTSRNLAESSAAPGAAGFPRASPLSVSCKAECSWRLPARSLSQSAPTGTEATTCVACAFLFLLLEIALPYP